MICTAQTTHGKPFGAAGHRLGPVPIRFWVTDNAKKKPPVKGLVAISTKAWEAIKAKAEASSKGLIHVEEDVSLEGAHEADALADALERCETLGKALEDSRKKADGAIAERDQLRRQLDALQKRFEELGRKVAAFQQSAQAQGRKVKNGKK